MRILDLGGMELENPDLSLGYLTEEEILISHHEAVEAAAEQWHYETIAEYPNGGKDVKKIVDIPGVEAQDAWDEDETIQRYVPYTEEELAAMEEARNKPTQQDDVDAMMIDHEYRLTILELGL